MSNGNDSVAPAPILSFPTMYNAKKVKQKAKATPAVHQTTSSNNTMSSTATTVTPSAALGPEQQRVKNMKDVRGFYDWAANINEKQDMRNLSRDERLALLEGPAADLICADQVVGSMPLRLVVATSKVARKKFVENNGEGITQIGVSYPDVGEALERLGKYLVTVMGVRNHPFSLQSTTVAKNIDLLFVAHTMGMNLYVHNVHRYWWAVLQSEALLKIGFDGVNALDNRVNEHTDRFPMLHMFVQRWSGIGLYSIEEDIPVIGNWGPDLPNLRAASERLLAEHAAKQAERAAKHAELRDKRLSEKNKRKKQEFEEQLRVARGGRSGGYGMGV